MMALNKVKGNMYEFLNDYPEKGSNRGYTYNTIKGKCPHNCAYCFMKKYGNQRPLRFDRSELKTRLLGEDGKENNFIFVGSSCDMWADSIISDHIDETIHAAEEVFEIIVSG